MNGTTIKNIEAMDSIEIFKKEDFEEYYDLESDSVDYDLNAKRIGFGIYR